MGKHNSGQRVAQILALLRLLFTRHVARPSLPQWAIDDTQPMTIATPVVRRGALSMDPRAVDEPPTWDEWLQQLPPVDGWFSTSCWEAQHGRGAQAVSE
jgi:hypothetical protein